MKSDIKIVLLLSIVLLVYGCKANKGKQLFNGKDLAGWEIYGTELWYVEDGKLVSESGPNKEYGYLATDKNYENFELTLEFLQAENGNSGVFIRSNIEGTKIAGWQVEVAPKGLHTGGIYESYGRGWLIKPEPNKEAFLKENEWNNMKIQVVDNVLTTWLNGNEMVHLEDTIIGEGVGKIALQIHDGGGIKVFWKNIVIKEILY